MLHAAVPPDMNDGCYITGNNFTQTYFYELIVEDKPTPFQASETGIFQEVLHFPFLWLDLDWMVPQMFLSSRSTVWWVRTFLNFWWDLVPRTKLYRESVNMAIMYPERGPVNTQSLSRAHTHIHGHIRTHTLMHASSTLPARGAVSFSVNVVLSDTWYCTHTNCDL